MPHETALLGTAVTDVFFDGVELGDVLERLGRNGRGAGSGELVEITPHMHSAKGKLNVAGGGKRGTAGLAVDL